VHRHQTKQRTTLGGAGAVGMVYVIGSVDEFAVELRVDGGDVTVRVTGEVELKRAVEDFGGVVTVNLASVTFFDLTALRALLVARSALDARGRLLVVADPAMVATRVFELTDQLHVFQPSNHADT
jgi:anti-anti-sigma regulatory factor